MPAAAKPAAPASDLATALAAIALRKTVDPDDRARLEREVEGRKLTRVAIH
jgi:hypothetical protein